MVLAERAAETEDDRIGEKCEAEKREAESRAEDFPYGRIAMRENSG